MSALRNQPMTRQFTYPRIIGKPKQLNERMLGGIWIRLFDDGESAKELGGRYSVMLQRTTALRPWLHCGELRFAELHEATLWFNTDAIIMLNWELSNDE